MPHKSSPSKARAAAAKHGIEIDEQDWAIILDAPTGYILRVNGEHEFTVGDNGDESRSEIWGDIHTAILLGIEVCPDSATGCAYEHEVIEGWVDDARYWLRDAQARGASSDTIEIWTKRLDDAIAAADAFADKHGLERGPR